MVQLPQLSQLITLGQSYLMYHLTHTGVSNLWPTGYIHPRITMNVAQLKLDKD